MSKRWTQTINNPRALDYYTRTRFGMTPAQTETALMAYAEIKERGELSKRTLDGISKLYPAVPRNVIERYYERVIDAPRHARHEAFVHAFGFGSADVPEIGGLAQRVQEADITDKLERRAAERDELLPESPTPQRGDSVRDDITAALKSNGYGAPKMRHGDLKHWLADKIDANADRIERLRSAPEDPDRTPGPTKYDREHLRESLDAAWDMHTLNDAADEILAVPDDMQPADDAPAKIE